MGRGGFRQGGGGLQLLAAGRILSRGQHRADSPLKQLRQVGGVLFGNAPARAEGGALLDRHRRQRKADAPAADGGQHPRQGLGRQQEQHPLGGLFHHLEQGVGRLAVHLFGMVKQHRPPLGGQAGVEDLAAHGGHLAHQVPAAGAHPLHGDGLPDHAGLHPAAVPVAGFGHRPAALPPQQGFGGGAAGRVEVIRRDAPGRKARAQALLPDQQQAVAQAAAGQHPAHFFFQSVVARKTVQHHGADPLSGGSAGPTVPAGTRPGCWTRGPAQRRG